MKALLATKVGEVYDQYESLDGKYQTGILIAFFASVFICLEYGMLYSPIGAYILRKLKGNPSLTEEQAQKNVIQVITRAVGSIHNSVQVPIAIWTICNADLQADRLYGTKPLSSLMLCITAGFFLHDAIDCLIRESPFYIIHGLTCCVGYATGAAFGVAHFYGGLFLMWECSTPFVQLRWVLYKMGLTETLLYKVNGILMYVAFMLARIVFGTVFTVMLVRDVYFEVASPRSGTHVPSLVWISFAAAALTITCLNYYWFSLMTRTLMRIITGGHTWTAASQDKQE